MIVSQQFQLSILAAAVEDGRPPRKSAKERRFERELDEAIRKRLSAEEHVSTEVKMTESGAAKVSRRENLNETPGDKPEQESESSQTSSSDNEFINFKNAKERDERIIKLEQKEQLLSSKLKKVRKELKTLRLGGKPKYSRGGVTRENI